MMGERSQEESDVSKMADWVQRLGTAGENKRPDIRKQDFLGQKPKTPAGRWPLCQNSFMQKPKREYEVLIGKNLED